MIHRKSRGFTLLEVVAGIVILSIISIVLYSILRVGVRTWRDVQTQLVGTSAVHQDIPVLQEKLTQSTQITDISLSDSLEGYIQYVDSYKTRITVFYNSSTNQQYFQVFNSYNQKSLAALYHQDGITSNTEILLDNVETFSIESYEEELRFYRVVTPNNTFHKPELSQINSIKYTLNRKKDNRVQEMEQLVSITRSPRVTPGEILYGEDGIEFKLGAKKSEHGSKHIDLFQGNGVNKGLVLSTPTKTVTIANTGIYYEKIQDAINAATQGDTVMVGAKSGGYVENIVLKRGVRLMGGYHPHTWERDIHKYETKLISKAGISSIPGLVSAIVVDDDCVIDGLSISGDELTYGIYGINADRIKVKNCRITEVDRPFNFFRGSGEIINNSVTANEHSIFIFDTHDGYVVARNRFYSKNQAQVENVSCRFSSKLNFYNNLVLGGYNLVGLKSISSSKFVNNIMSGGENFGFFALDAINIDVHNNGIFSNNVGILFAFTNSVTTPNNTVEYNLFANNLHGHSLDFIPSNTNILITLPLSVWELNNPYFIDLNDFALKDGGFTTLVDKGNPDASYNDVYLNGFPSLGTVVSDIGLYGGPLSGRVGVGDIHRFNVNDGADAIHEQITQSFIGDQLLFEKGTFFLTELLTLKPEQYLGGISADQSIIQSIHNDSLLTASDGLIIENIWLKAPNQDAIETSQLARVFMHRSIIDPAQTGIDLNKSLLVLQHSMIRNTTTGVNMSDSSEATINYTFFDDNTLGINNESSHQVVSFYNFFRLTPTIVSGGIDDQNTNSVINTGEAVFWNESEQNFLLHPSSNMIDVQQLHDVGAFEFFTLSGHIETPLYENAIARKYKKVEIKLSTIDALDMDNTHFYLDYINDGKLLTLAQVIGKTTASDTTLSWNFPTNVFSDHFKIRLRMNSYRYDRTPYISSVKLVWD